MSIGLRSRGLAGQGKTCTDVACFQKLLWYGTHEALSCARIMFLLSKMKRTRIGRIMPSWYLLAVRQLMTRKSGVLCAQRFRILPRSRYFRLHQICPCPQFKRRRGVLLACETTVFYRREFVDLFWFVNKKERWPSQLSFICIAVVPMQDVLFNVSGQIFLWIVVSCRVNIHATYINEKWC